MNREEAVKIIKSNRPIYRDWQEEFDEAVERLEQPLTLAEFLGWEEGVEYRRRGNIFKVEGNHLLHKKSDGKFYNTTCYTAELIDLRNATKYEPKYYAKIKGWELIPNDYCYFGLDDNHDLEIKDACDAYEFTKKEWSELGITDENADFEEAG